MIDIHCHLLPQIDDGPADKFAALDLARQAVENGITHCVVTPHIHLGRWDNTIDLIQRKVGEFRILLAQARIPLTVGYAAEVRICPEIMSLLENEQLPMLGRWEGKQVLLLEMPHSHILPGTEKIVSWLLKRDVVPMIAHPERNKDVMGALNKIFPLVDLGCLFQITAGSLIGQFGQVCQDRATSLLTMGAVTVLASDAHHVRKRPANLREGHIAAARILGDQASHDLVYKNPLSIARYQFLEVADNVVQHRRN